MVATTGTAISTAAPIATLPRMLSGFFGAGTGC